MHTGIQADITPSREDTAASASQPEVREAMGSAARLFREPSSATSRVSPCCVLKQFLS